METKIHVQFLSALSSIGLKVAMFQASDAVVFRRLSLPGLRPTVLGQKFSRFALSGQKAYSYKSYRLPTTTPKNADNAAVDRQLAGL